MALVVTLVVKEGTLAEDRVRRRLNEWFTESPVNPPYEPGTLLMYTIKEEANATT